MMRGVFGRRGRGRRGDGEAAEGAPAADPEEMYRSLRAMALGAVDQGLPAPPAEHPDVAGLVVDIPSEGGYATIVALTDDTTSLYTSTGGGTIGAGNHPQVAALTHVLLAIVQAHLAAFPDPPDDGLPSEGSVRFHVVRPDGGGGADVPVDCFWGQREHDLMPVIAAMQDILTALHQVTPP